MSTQPETLEDLEYKKKEYKKALKQIDKEIKKKKEEGRKNYFTRFNNQDKYITDVKEMYCKGCENFFTTNLDVENAICPHCSKINNIIERGYDEGKPGTKKK